MVTFGPVNAILVDAAVGFVTSDGHAALFVFVVLETAWILHFVPSEVVIPAAAAVLVNDPAGLVVPLTVGAVVGSLLASVLFGARGDAALVWLVYRGADGRAPLEVLIDALLALLP